MDIEKNNGLEPTPEEKKWIEAAAPQRLPILEIIPEDHPEFIQRWSMYMEEEQTDIFTCHKNGWYPLTQDGSVFFGTWEELHIIRELNGVPFSKDRTMWLMKPEGGAWGIYDCNLKQHYGPFADIEEAIDHIESNNYSVEGVWRSL